MPKLSRDLGLASYAGLTTLNPRESLFASGALASLAAEIGIPVDGCSSIGLVVTGTYVGTITVEGSIDGANWDAVPIKPVNAGGLWAITLASAAVGRWHGPVGPFRFVRARMSAFTSGAANVVLVGENGVSDVVATVKAADLSVTNTGVAAAAVTLTIPAAGAGLFHFITRILVQRHASALLTAGATPVLVTTTNLPGTRVLSFPADAAAAGSVYSEEISPANPLRSSAANTATTVVCPATTGVIWRVTADYYAAPHA